MNITYLGCPMPGDASHQDDTSSVPEPFHLLASGLRSEEHTVYVDIKDL